MAVFESRPPNLLLDMSRRPRLDAQRFEPDGLSDTLAADPGKRLEFILSPLQVLNADDRTTPATADWSAVFPGATCGNTPGAKFQAANNVALAINVIVAVNAFAYVNVANTVFAAVVAAVWAAIYTVCSTCGYGAAFENNEPMQLLGHEAAL